MVVYLLVVPTLIVAVNMTSSRSILSYITSLMARCESETVASTEGTCYLLILFGTLTKLLRFNVIKIPSYETKFSNSKL